MHHLWDQFFKLFKLQRSVVHGRWQPEAMVHQDLFASAIAVVHGPDLGNRDVGFIDEKQPVVRAAFGREAEIIEHGMRPGAFGAAFQLGGIVLDPLAKANFLKHLQVVLGA